MSTIGTVGSVGSGLDVESIVKALVDADVAPKNNSLNRRESDLTSEFSAIGQLKAALSGLDTALTGLHDGTTFDSMTIDSPDAVDVLQTGAPVEGQYSLDVNALAASQVLASGGFAASSTVVGTGTLTFKIGAPTYVSGNSGAYGSFSADETKTVSVSIDSTKQTVAGIRDAVNASNVGVTASLVADGSQTRLIFTADDSGAGTAITVSVDDDDLTDTNASGLSQLAYNVDSGSFTGNLSEARSSQDASFMLNGLALTSASNTLTDLVEGLNFTLKKVTSSAESILVKTDTAAIEAKVQGFVDAYNAYQETLDSVTDYKDSAGALAGDATARRIQASIRSATTGAVSLAGNSFTALSDIGVTSDRYGKLTLKSSDFQAALNSNSSDMRTFFSGNKIAVSLTDNTDSTGLADLIKSKIDIYVNASSGMLSSRETQIDSEIDDIAADRLDIIERMSALEARYTRQFTAMDTLVGQLKGTSDFLSNQMDAIKAAANR